MKELLLGPDNILPIIDYRKGNIITLLYRDKLSKIYALTRNYTHEFRHWSFIEIYPYSVEILPSSEYYTSSSVQHSCLKCIQDCRIPNNPVYKLMHFESVQEYLHWLKNNINAFHLKVE
jgi:hypothetical protein